MTVPYNDPNAYGTPPATPYGTTPAVVARPSMGFGQAIKAFFQNYVVFHGRASRSEFCWPMLLVTILSVVGVIALYAPLIGLAAGANPNTGQVSDEAAAGAVASFGVMGLIFGIVSLALLLPSLGVYIRRLHDMDKSGWFYLIAFIPFGSLALLIWCAVGGSDPAGARFDDPSGRQPAIGA